MPAYSQSTIRIASPSSMKLPFSRSLWHGRSTGGPHAASDVRAALRPLYSSGIDPVRRRGVPVELDDPERVEAAGMAARRGHGAAPPQRPTSSPDGASPRAGRPSPR